ncbi:hypothetical protein F4821DRAFT_230142 [Hypoxylon rubiginosum]|uniref:Uncharacterized protein n=1 Tax=Hypoxylon rubiginosum TaxID=110542 RepID=A0ACC0DAV3_9PEZI|nr:hypothetical protein F4821DRAFT_230142 [Hypoxylon rubiginosum]
MQLSSILLLSLFGSALSLTVPGASSSQIATRDESPAASTRSESETVSETRDVDSGKKLQARGYILRTDPISETQTLNTAQGGVLSVEQLRFAHGSPVAPWQQVIGNDLDSLGNNAASQQPSRSGYAVYSGSIHSYRIEWTVSGYTTGTIRLMGPEWQTLIQALYRKMVNEQANQADCYMNIESTAGFDIKLTVL